MDRIQCYSVPTQAASHRNATGHSNGNVPLTDSDGREPNASQAPDLLCHGVIITDVEGRVVYMNRRAEMVIGRTHKQVLGKSIVEALIGTQYQLRGEDRVRRTETADEGQFTVQLESSGIGGRLVEVRAVPLFDEFSVNSGELYEIHDVSESAQHTQQLIHAADVLKSVDQACERAKSSGGDRIVVERQFKNPGKLTVAHRIIPRKLFNEKYYRLYQQPIFSLHAADTIRRIDVLVRLLDKDRIILPHEFMPDVGRYGLESELDQWVITALVNAWANRYSVSDSRPLQCFMNLSTSSIAETGSTIDYLSDLIEEYQLPDGLICFNIQECQVIECETQVAELTQCLAGKGVKFALDGVGAGQDLYSLGYLRDISVDYIKLSAQALVKSADDTVYAAYVQALSNISRVLDVSLIGVGTEDQDDLRHFKEFKVDYVQGHALSAPEPFSLGWIDTPARAIKLPSAA